MCADDLPDPNDHQSRWPHCDTYIDDPEAPACLRAFLDHARSPAHGAWRSAPQPALFALYQGEPVRVVMASRLGDLGISRDLSGEASYFARVPVAALSNFSDQAPDPQSTELQP